MNIRVICIGKLKEKYWVEAVGEYSKRLTKYCNLSIEELKEDSLFEEGENILKRIKKETFVITLEIKGNMLDSEALAEKIETLGMEGKSDITFIIGGSTGLSEEVSRRADFKLSFSKMTFPHQMMRVIMLEQVYRSFKIIKGETYHK
ncbi:MAG: 23S rRNA (pseudouridine(1915)-N(3))-methyltransferase RlmH [Peptostreptococcaceae bacterium]|nr:23S rRNA (pseudouridine(1915)-N(3))-methyltransferase RlmH [Peptostreptococcaceae bacterium]